MRRHREGSAGAGLEDAAEDADKSDEVSPATALSSDANDAANRRDCAQEQAQGDGVKASPSTTPQGPKPPPYGSMAEALGYVVFLVIFVVATAVLDEDPQAFFFFANRVSAALSDQLFATSMEQAVVSSSSTASDGVSTLVLPPVSLSGIHDQTQAWSFLTGPFLDVVYGGTNANNVLLGSVVMRTLRVSPGSCPALDESMPEYASAMPLCYGAFSRDSEQTSSYGQVLNAAAVSASAAYQFAIAFFKEKPSPHAYADLQTCLSQCATSCGGHFGSVDAFRYAQLCAADCDTHCMCVYEQPADFTSLCVDPNPNGAGAPVPDPVYPFNWYSGADEYTPFGSAPSGAYVVMLDTNPVSARTYMSMFRQFRMLDLATRALVVDLVLFNSYLRLFNAMKLVFEFPPTGGARVSLSDVAVRVFRYSSTSSSSVVARITLESLVLAYIAWRWKCMVAALVRARGLRPLVRSSKWHALSLAQLLAFSLWIALRLYESDLVYGIFSSTTAVIDEVRASLLSSTPGTPSKPPNLLPLAIAQYFERIMGSWCAGLTWFKLLQYSTMFCRSHVLLRSLARATPDLLWFLAVLVACVCAFAQIGVMLFGLDLFTFRSLGAAIPTMFHAVAGAGGNNSLDYEQLKVSHPALGPLFYIGYYLLLFLIVVNVFWAIVSDAYAQTLAEQEEEDEGQQQDESGTRSEAVMDADRDGKDDDRALAIATEAARREIDKLRRYPFSNGFRPAMRLLAVDTRRALYELRTGRKLHLTKVDPLVSVVLGNTTNTAGSAHEAQPTHAVASRNLDRHVRGHVERELLRLEHKMRITRQVDEQQTQINALRAALETDVGERLAALTESNERKTECLSDLESALRAIEGLCRQLVADTAFLRSDDGPNADGSIKSRRSAGRLGTATAMGLRTGTPPRCGSPATSTGSGAKRATGKNQSLSAAILANRQRELLASPGGGSRRKPDGGAGEEIEEITL